MANAQSAMGQLSRAGNSLAPSQKRLITSKKFNLFKVEEAIERNSINPTRHYREGGPGSGPRAGKGSAAHNLLLSHGYKYDGKEHKEHEKVYKYSHPYDGDEVHHVVPSTAIDQNTFKKFKDDPYFATGHGGYIGGHSGLKGYLSDRPKSKESQEGGPGSGPQGGKSEGHLGRAGNRPRARGPKQKATFSQVMVGKRGQEQMAIVCNRCGQEMRDTSREGLAAHANSHRNSVNESRKLHKANIRESMSPSMVFHEQGQDDVSKAPGGQKQKNRVYLVTIIEEGMGNSKDRNFYSAEALTKGANLFNGTKAYADHPDAITEKTLPERSMKDLVGWYSNCQASKDPATGKVRITGKLHFFPAAKWLTDMIDTILTDPTAKGLFGISINAIGKTRPAHQGNDTVNYVEAFQRVDSADVVTEPAARGKFEKILESRTGAKGRSTRVVTNSMKRMREALSPAAIKKLADSATAAMNSDNPDEMKQTLYDIQKELYPVSSMSGKGSGEPNENQYSNVNPTGGSNMAKQVKRPVRASTGGGRVIRKKKRFTHEADGTGADNENLGSPSPDDIEQNLEEADVEDEEDSSLDDIDDYGDGSKFKKNSEAMGNGNRRRPAMRRPVEEDEGMEGMEGLEGLEDEGADDGMSAGPSPGSGQGGGLPSPASAGPSMSSGGPSGSRMQTADQDDDGDGGDMEDQDDSMGDGDDMGMDDDLDQGQESEEGFEDQQPQQRPMMASGRRGRKPVRGRSGTREASLSGSLGDSGEDALPSHAIGDNDEDYTVGKRDRSTSGTGKSYKIKTSAGSTNRPVAPKFVRKIVNEANRRISILENGLMRLRESVRGKERVIQRYHGIISFHNSKVLGHRLLESAVRKGWFGEDEELASGYARAIEPKLYGLNKQDQIQEIRVYARLRESTAGVAESSAVRMLEGVEGVGARGGSVSSRTTVDRDSELVESMAGDGIPFKEDE
jgi:hypothetical protein